VEIPDGMSDVCALTSTTAGGFVAFGRAGDRIAAWTSTDGATWVDSTIEHRDVTPVTDETLLPSRACSVVAGDGALVAVMGVDDLLTWTSRDGVGWEFQEELELAGIRAGTNGHRLPLAVVGRQVLLVDTRSDPGEPDGLRQVMFVGVLEP
jgi:hypothetical protein